MTAITQPSTTAAGAVLWRIAQAVVLVVTVGLIVELFFDEKLALFVLWNILIPLVPASLLISPLIWRNVCPLATITTWVNPNPGRKLSAGAAARTGIVAVALLMILVPARRFFFNTDGTVLGAVIIAVVLAALVLGVLFDTKAGFCNAICPILPVERIYGQAPLMHVPNARCPTCSLCTQRGCIDLAPTKSIAQTLGHARVSTAWLRTGFGVFAALLPGFIIGYYTLDNVAPAAAGSVYLHVALWAAGSYLLTSAVVFLLRPDSAVAMVVLGGAAVGLYYWYTADVVLSAMHVAGLWTMALRGVMILLVGIWLAEALPRAVAHRSGAA